MKLDPRDACWLVITLVLLTLLGLEWRRASLIANEIRELSSTERPLELVNADIENAAHYVAWRYNARITLDWPSLKTVGIHHRTKATCTIPATDGRAALEQLFGEKVEVVKEEESSQVLGRPVFIIRARQSN